MARIEEREINITVGSLPFYIPSAWKRYPFRAEPSRIVHYREHPPGLLICGCILDWLYAVERVCIWEVSVSIVLTVFQPKYQIDTKLQNTVTELHVPELALVHEWSIFPFIQLIWGPVCIICRLCQTSLAWVSKTCSILVYDHVISNLRHWRPSRRAFRRYGGHIDFAPIASHIAY